MKQSKAEQFKDKILELKQCGYGSRYIANLPAKEQTKILTDILGESIITSLNTKVKRSEAYRKFLKGGNNVSG